MDANIEALDNLHDNLREHGYDLVKIPYVLQLNKRDLPTALPVDNLKKELMRKSEPVFEAVPEQPVAEAPVAEPVMAEPVMAEPVMAEAQFADASAAAEQPSNGKRSLGFFAH